MFKNYHLKWYLIVTGVLTCTTSLSILLRHDGFSSAAWWEYVEYALQLVLTIFLCWLVHGIFLLNNFRWLHKDFKHAVSNTIATLLTFALGFVLYKTLPKSSLNENSVPYDTLSHIFVRLIGAFLASIICYVIFYSVYTNMALQDSKLENEKLEQAHLRAQLISLQQQISPHFLFNSLSTLKTLTSDAYTKNYIVQLAAVYRYVLNYHQHYLTPLADELNFIRSYLYILTTRFEESLQIDIDVPDAHLNLLIPPLSVQLLIENAVKHNMILADRPLKISIRTDASPALVVTNNLQLKTTAEEGTGTGLNNIKERYKLLVHRPVLINNTDGNFTVTLPLVES